MRVPPKFAPSHHLLAFRRNFFRWRISLSSADVCPCSHLSVLRPSQKVTGHLIRGSRLRYWLHPLQAPRGSGGFLSLYRMKPAYRQPCNGKSRTRRSLARLPFGIFCGRPVCHPAYRKWARSLNEGIRLQVSGFRLEVFGFQGCSEPLRVVVAATQGCICRRQRVMETSNSSRGKEANHGLRIEQ